jgi:hypothetical protein
VAGTGVRRHDVRCPRDIIGHRLRRGFRDDREVTEFVATDTSGGRLRVAQAGLASPAVPSPESDCHGGRRTWRCRGLSLRHHRNQVSTIATITEVAALIRRSLLVICGGGADQQRNRLGRNGETIVDQAPIPVTIQATARAAQIAANMVGPGRFVVVLSRAMICWKTGAGSGRRLPAPDAPRRASCNKHPGPGRDATVSGDFAFAFHGYFFLGVDAA